MGAFLHTFTPFVEVLIISVMVYYMLSFFWNTRSMDLVLGVLAFLLIFAASSWLHLPILHKLMFLVANVAVIALLIIFQPEVRMALSKLSFKGKRYRESTEFDKFLEQLATSVYRLAEKRVGALIVLEHEHLLGEFASKAVPIGAVFSSELLESIFAPTAPLHDGAVILRNKTLLAASVILPLAEESAEVSRSMGTRHRAGLGLTQITDALVIVVSEESGKVSIAREGVMTHGVKPDRFKGVIRSLFTPPPVSELKGELNFLQWLKR